MRCEELRRVRPSRPIYRCENLETRLTMKFVLNARFLIVSGDFVVSRRSEFLTQREPERARRKREGGRDVRRDHEKKDSRRNKCSGGVVNLYLESGTRTTL